MSVWSDTLHSGAASAENAVIDCPLAPPGPGATRAGGRKPIQFNAMAKARSGMPPIERESQRLHVFDSGNLRSAARIEDAWLGASGVLLGIVVQVRRFTTSILLHPQWGLRAAPRPSS